MAITQDKEFCVEHNTADYMWYTPSTQVWQCDACWDNAREDIFGLPRQYGTTRSDSEQRGK